MNQTPQKGNLTSQKIKKIAIGHFNKQLIENMNLYDEKLGLNNKPPFPEDRDSK